MGPPVGRARSPPGLGPHLSGARGYSPPKDPRPVSRSSGDLSMDFSIISQHHWIIEVGAFKIVKVSLLQRGIGS